MKVSATQLLGLGLLGAGLALVGGARRGRPARSIAPAQPPVPSRSRQKELTHAARRLNASAGLLSLSVLADSGLEHYRGSFQNPAMYTPLITSALTLAASLFGTSDPRPRKHPVRDIIYGAAALTGFAGFGFHTYNITKRPGGLCWLNLFYAAPIGAPIAMTLAGLMGRGAERVRDTPRGERPTLLGSHAGPVLAGVGALGLVGTVGEAGLLHFRGAYHNPAMFLPVTLPPVAALLLASTAVVPGGLMMQVTRWWLRTTAALGVAGVGFHAFGVSRNMGGWRNWRQNILNGPPLPAPPSFTGLALAGLAALDLIEDHIHEQSISGL